MVFYVDKAVTLRVNIT